MSWKLNEPTNFRKNFHDVLKSRVGVEIKCHCIVQWTNWVTSGPYEFPGVFIKNLRSWFVTLWFPPTNKGRVSTGSGKSGKVRGFVKGSGKSQGWKFLSMQIFNFNKKVICTQKCVQLICIWQSVAYMMLLFASSIKVIIVWTLPPFWREGDGINFDYLPWRGGRGIWKNKKRGGRMQFFLKREGWHFSYFFL